MSGALAADEQPVLAADGDGDGAHGTLGEHLSIQTLEANGKWRTKIQSETCLSSRNGTATLFLSETTPVQNPCANCSSEIRDSESLPSPQLQVATKECVVSGKSDPAMFLHTQETQCLISP